MPFIILEITMKFNERKNNDKWKLMNEQKKFGEKSEILASIIIMSMSKNVIRLPNILSVLDTYQLA